MKYRYIKWDENEKCAIFFPDIDFDIWKKTQLLENDYANPTLIISSHLKDKVGILELFEYCILLICGKSMGVSRWECNNLILLDTYSIDNISSPFYLNTPKPTYISEYINVLGQLFLAGYIDFGSYCDEDRNKIDYPSNLSYYKEDKYQAWIYFRDNFFYKERFIRELDDLETLDEDGCSLVLGNVSWDTPQYWSQYNIWIATTPKGTNYFQEILAPKFYNKYKDLEVEIDDKGNVLRWIGEINRDKKY
ncbi:hypothetical protein F0O47_08390 [Campylobacter jejuni]|nr:hypothetical protein [Campylobacter jejuni]